MFRLNYDIDISQLNDIMLLKLEEPFREINDCKKPKNLENHNFGKIPSSQIKINYTKKYSKYNEPSNINDSKLNNYDNLFWIFYTLNNEISKEDLNKINKFKYEKNIKFDIIDEVKKNKNKIKQHKFTLNTIEDNLINDSKITYKTFLILCLIHNINLVIILDDKIYTTLISDESKAVIKSENFKIIDIKRKHSKDIVSSNLVINIIDISDSILTETLNNLYYVDNIEKPLKSISSYSLNDLTNIADKININYYTENCKKLKKQDIYLKIIDKIL